MKREPGGEEKRRGSSGGRLRGAFSRVWGGFRRAVLKVRMRLRLIGLRLGLERFIELDLLAIVVGAVAGLGAVGFRYLIEWAAVAFDVLGSLGVAVGPFWLPLGLLAMPAIGGLLVGVMVTYGAPEAEGHGVPEVMTALALEGGRIRPRVPVVKAIASAVTIGSGGSAGSEGPIGQIGAGAGSALGQLFHLREPELKVLTVCGISAGIAAIFNAPIGGALFGLEVVMMGIEPVAVIPVLISTVVGTAISSYFFGQDPWFTVPSHPVSYGPELLLFFLLGAVMGVLSVVWIKALYSFEDGFRRLPIPRPFKPALGGLLVGFIIIFFPQTARVGYETIEVVLTGEALAAGAVQAAMAVLLMLTLMKIANTSSAIGSGGSGGVFAPSLYMGALAGGAMGMALQVLVPGMVTPPMAFAVVGMAALFAGAARAPLTCIIMIAEMTADYRLLVPLMAACATSYLVSILLHHHSIYTLKLALRGIRLKQQLIVDILDTITVRQVMRTKDIVAVRPNMLAFQVLELADTTGHSALPVLEGDRLLGLVTFRQAYDALKADLPPEQCTVERIATKPPPTIHPDATVHQALDLMLQTGASLLCVTDPDDPNRFLGIVSHADILRAHNLERAQREAIETKTIKEKRTTETNGKRGGEMGEQRRTPRLQ